MWLGTSRQLCLLLERQLGLMKDPQQLLKVKRIVSDCISCMEGEPYCLVSTNMKTLLQNSYETFKAVTLNSVQQKFTEIFAADHFQSMQVVSESQKKQLEDFGLLKGEDPCTVSFSSPGDTYMVSFSDSVPRITEELHTLVEICSSYIAESADVSSQGQQGAVCDTVNQAVEMINSQMAAMLEGEGNDGRDIAISQACQIAANCTALAHGCDILEKTIGHKTGQLRDAVSLKNRHKLEERTDRAHGMVFELVTNKIDELLVSAYYVDWAPSEIESVPHPFVEDLVSYLQVTFFSFSFLPGPVRQSVQFTSCARICSALTETLTSSAEGGEQSKDQQFVKKINVIGFYNFQQDINALVHFAESCDVEQLTECFSPLIQLCKLLLSEDIEQILEPEIRESTYPLVDLNRLKSVLYKYKELGGMSSARKRAQNAGIVLIKKRNVDQLLKRLPEY